MKARWSTPLADGDHDAVQATVLNNTSREQLDLFDYVKLAFAIRVCRESATISEAGRKLFAATRAKRKIANDANRLRKYLARFDLDWPTAKASDPAG